MSIMINNGYIIEKKNLTVIDLYELLNSYKNEVDKIYQELLVTEIAKLSSLFLDNFNLYGNEIASKEVRSKYHFTPSTSSLEGYIKELIIKDSDSHFMSDDKFDFSCNLYIYPHLQGTLFRVNAEKEEFKELFGLLKEEEEMPSPINPYIKPFVWFNNTDKLSSVSDEDWLRREILWREFINSKNYICFNMTDIHLNIKIPYDKVIDKIKDLYEKRVNYLAFMLIDKDFSSNNEWKSMGDMIDSFLIYKDSIEHQEKLNLYKKNIKNKIPLTYNREDFKKILL